MKKYWFAGIMIFTLLFSACGPAAPVAEAPAPAEPAEAETTAPLPPAETEPPTALPTEAPTDEPTVEPTAPPEPLAMDGQTLLEERCSTCHPLMMIELANYPNPNVWRSTVNDMVSRGAVLNDEETEVLIKYLMEDFQKGESIAATDGSQAIDESALNAVESLGMKIFFDENLSVNRNQSCATCHGPEVGFVGPDEAINLHGGVYEGSIAGVFGNRKPPSAAYATFSPVLSLVDGEWVGGNFYDGRATGEKLGSPAADQAQGPFLNPKEQALSEGACVVYRICSGDYQDAFIGEYPDACDIAWPEDADASCAAGELVALDEANRAKAEGSYDKVALAIAAYEGSPLVNQFSSKFDAVQQGLAEFNEQEQLGFELFQGDGECAECHAITGEKPLLTDFSYHNLGIPANPENPVYEYDPAFVDPGLGGYLESAGYEEAVYAPVWGMFKTATLRSVSLSPEESIVKSHMHNGYFKSLYGIVHFYNTRDILPVCPDNTSESQALIDKCWPEPEYAENIDAEFIGDMGLTFEQEMAIVAFLKTLSDGYIP